MEYCVTRFQYIADIIVGTIIFPIGKNSGSLRNGLRWPRAIANTFVVCAMHVRGNVRFVNNGKNVRERDCRRYCLKAGDSLDEKVFSFRWIIVLSDIIIVSLKYQFLTAIFCNFKIWEIFQTRPFWRNHKKNKNTNRTSSNCNFYNRLQDFWESTSWISLWWRLTWTSYSKI